MSNKLQTKVTGMGFWSSVLLVILSIAFIVSVVATYYVNHSFDWWGGGEKAPLTFYVSLTLALLSAVLLTMLMVSIHFYAPEEKKIFSNIAVAFTLIGVALISLNYYVQLTVVLKQFLADNTEGLQMFIYQNTASVMFAVDIVGYFFIGLAMFFVAPVFGNGLLELFIRWFFVLTGLANLSGVVGHVLNNTAVLIGMLGGMSVLLLVNSILLCIMFVKAEVRLVESELIEEETAEVA